MSNLFRLVEAMQDMMRDQERNFLDKCAADEVLTARDLTGPSSEYLGELRIMISSKGLSLIQRQYRIARKAMPTARNPFPTPLQDCGSNCYISTELGIPCSHTIYEKLGSGIQFTKWEVHPHWRLRESSSKDPYRRILDPKITLSLRGRSRNTPQAMPSTLAISMDSQSQLANTETPTDTSASQVGRQVAKRKRGRPVESRNQSTLARIEQETSQQDRSVARVTRSQSAVLGPGQLTGVRATGRRLQPNIRRIRSQWELISSDEE
ncbi:hypothetical protein BGZ61DRAFT_368721 [Ilyonectria robusta]|uniref:uncharacterized protein n=1 Tax=Ilyonectria robusta TaxID=1079257 RepID=UPI001E8DAFC0|nr:uncharacterized protein BGZ61DRAFT_368721 [Ilyonectria robusta]KAH8661812.1 hypothetical protein BGZ61DRAFT_368721 [Ilyonectria robusta]